MLFSKRLVANIAHSDDIPFRCPASVFAERNLSSLLMYRSLIKLHCTIGSLSNIKYAKQLLKEAIQDESATPKMFTYLIKAYGKLKLFDKAREIFDLAKQHNIVNSYIYHSMIFVYAKNRQIKQAEGLLNEALDDVGIRTPHLFKPLLVAYGLQRRIDGARIVFEKARTLELADGSIYSAFIFTQLRKHNFGSAELLFIEACEKEVATKEMFDSLIKTFSDLGQTRRVQRITKAWYEVD